MLRTLAERKRQRHSSRRTCQRELIKGRRRPRRGNGIRFPTRCVGWPPGGPERTGKLGYASNAHQKQGIPEGPWRIAQAAVWLWCTSGTVVRQEAKERGDSRQKHRAAGPIAASSGAKTLAVQRKRGAVTVRRARVSRHPAVRLPRYTPNGRSQARLSPGTPRGIA